MTTQRGHYYGLLDQPQEDALHASRLLQVEERPFQRVARALLGKESFLRETPRQLPSPPPDGEEGTKSTEPLSDGFQLQKFREELLLDFAALESSIVRIQMIQSSNERERERYAMEKAKILSTAQAVKESSAQLRIQLREAQEIMEQRKGYDDLATKILEDTKIQSREESQAEIERLEKEIEDLEQESLEYDATWTGRRAQFDRVVAEGEATIRLIKGIKDEPDEEKNDAEEMEDDENTVDVKGEMSYGGTPAPGDRTPMVGEDDADESVSVRAGHQSSRVDELKTSASAAASPLHQQLDLEMIEEPLVEKEQGGEAGIIDEMDES